MSFEKFMENLTTRRILGIIVIMAGVFISALGFNAFFSTRQNVNFYDSEKSLLYMGLVGVLISVSGVLIARDKSGKRHSEILDEDQFDGID